MAKDQKNAQAAEAEAKAKAEAEAAEAEAKSKAEAEAAEAEAKAKAEAEAAEAEAATQRNAAIAKARSLGLVPVEFVADHVVDDAAKGTDHETRYVAGELYALPVASAGHFVSRGKAREI